MATVLNSGHGTVQLHVRGPHLIVVTYSGVVDMALAALVEPSLEAAFATASAPAIFANLEKVTAYTSERRVATTEFWKRNLDRVGAVHVLVDPQSRFVAMAAEVINLSLNGVGRIHRERASFEHEMDRVVKGLAKTG